MDLITVDDQRYGTPEELTRYCPDVNCGGMLRPINVSERTYQCHICQKVYNKSKEGKSIAHQTPEPPTDTPHDMPLLFDKDNKEKKYRKENPQATTNE